MQYSVLFIPQIANVNILFSEKHYTKAGSTTKPELPSAVFVLCSPNETPCTLSGEVDRIRANVFPL